MFEKDAWMNTQNIAWHLGLGMGKLMSLIEVVEKSPATDTKELILYSLKSISQDLSEAADEFYIPNKPFIEGIPSIEDIK